MSEAKKPTPRQTEALVAIRAGEVTMRNMGHAAYRILGPIQPTVVGACIKHGWAMWPQGAMSDGQTCELTAAGQVLAAETDH